ncbi:autotransporter domain-containing protein (plasmid) [Pantoea cypripedii]|uniref:Autotransporter domain-containing protein n=1 Tax=Pantoea cypripedii TaxID=55209 RepID=A0A6B9G2I3_PANCY|nr:autotransporter domain-containing protein [Pantoea cypripedii]
MVRNSSRRKALAGFAFLVLSGAGTSSAYALSAGCTAVNALSGATTLNGSSSQFPAAQFNAGDTLTVTFTDSGAAYGASPLSNYDVMDLMNYDETAFQSYGAFQSTSATSHTVTVTYARDLATEGVAFFLSTDYSQISNVQFSCTGTASSSVATLSALSLSAGTLSPAFSAATTSYTASVANSVASITVTPTPTDTNATVTVNGSAVTSGSASAAISLTAGATTSIPVIVTAQDGTTTDSYSVNVSRAEAAPVAANVAATVAANSSDNPITLAMSGGTPTSVAVATAPAHGTTTVSGTSITYTPTTGYSGSDSFTYNATNTGGTSADATVSLTVSAPALSFTPVAGALPGATLGSAWSQTVAASGGTAPYSYAASGLPAGITLNSITGVLSGTPAAIGSYTIQVTATDSNNATGTVSYTLSVGDQAPEVSAVSATVDAGSTNNAISLAISGSATSVAIVQQAAHGTATVSGLRILYTPVAGYSGSDTFTYSATNAYGTSQVATVSLNVTAVTLAMTPDSGALASGTVGQSYTQTFSVSGGTSPYSWQLSGTLPQGLTFTNGSLQGTPTSAGSSSFTLTATDANGVAVHGAYTLVINAAAPQAIDHSASLYAGQSVKINLTAGASGGPFTAARLLNQPDSRLGTASIQSADAGWQLLFTAASGASGTVTLRYVLTSASGTSEPALVTLTIASRPDPSKDADVIGMISAQFQAAQNFARAQIRNFNDRLEQLHNGAEIPSDMTGIHFNLPTARAERDTDRDLWATAWSQQRKYQQDAATKPAPAAPFASNNTGNRLSYWTGGYIDFGSDKDDAVRFSHTLVGISTGADYRFTPTFTAGMGLGFGRDVSDIGDSGTRNNGRSLSSALYASYHPNGFFIDGLMGYSRLEFDSKRYVSESDVFARGDRSGRQFFSSLTSGYEFRTLYSLISPYGRVQYYRTWLDSFAESNAGAFNLAFAPQSFSEVTTSAGLRGEHSVPVSWGLVKLQGRIEYSQLMDDVGRAGVGYADVGNDNWAMSVYEQSRKTLALGIGLDFLLPHDITPGIAYQGTLGLDEKQTRSQMIMIRVNIGF